MNILECHSFFLSWFYWNPPRAAFHLPYVNHPVVWYGVCFAVGFLCAYFVARGLLKTTLLAQQVPEKLAKDQAVSLTDRLILYGVAGIIVGARLGEVLFYGSSYYFEHPLEIFKIWEGGLASHGGVAGLLLAVWLFRLSIKKRYSYLSFLFIMDIVAIAGVLAGAFIRIGNFFNQEILGIETTVPWAVVFGNPWNGEAVVPRHPVQLYEALAYFATFAAMICLWKRKGPSAKAGTYLGWVFICVFTARFLLEFLKLPQTVGVSSEGFLSTGQYLSLPFIAAGIFLVVYRPKT